MCWPCDEMTVCDNLTVWRFDWWPGPKCPDISAMAKASVYLCHPCFGTLVDSVNSVKNVHLGASAEMSWWVQSICTTSCLDIIWVFADLIHYTKLNLAHLWSIHQNEPRIIVSFYFRNYSMSSNATLTSVPSSTHMFVNVLFDVVIFHSSDHQKLQLWVIASPDFSPAVISLLISI